jgi:flavin-dependent dehydrogenase
MLFRNAARQGVVTLEGWTVREVDLEGAAGVALELKNGAGERRHLTCRELVDASGRDGLLARKLDLRQPSQCHQSAAIYAHFAGAVHQEGRRAGNISVYWFEHGWLWMIPLPGGTMSVGAVANLPFIRGRRVPLERFLDDTIAACPGVAARLADAHRVGPVHAASNYSYGASRMFGRNWTLIGDAFAFVDPVFSSGVHFAMAGTEITVAGIAARLAGDPGAERRLVGAERAIRRGLDAMSWLIYRFNTSSLRRLFMNPRDVLGIERAILAILAGDVFGRTRLGWRYGLFKLAYGIDTRLERLAQRLPRERLPTRLRHYATPGS